MDHDTDIRKMRINCSRRPKVAGEFTLRMRAPGVMIETRHLPIVQGLCERYDNRTFYMGTRQTLDVPRVRCENIEAVNKFLKGYIHDVDVEMYNVDMEVNDYGHPTIGARNVMSCTGNAHCIKGNINTYELVREAEKIIFPSHYHIEVAAAGRPNGYVKVNFNDFGIMGVNKQDYDIDRCIGCGSCVDACKHHATEVLSLNKNSKADKDVCCYVGYGECFLICPTGAWTRGTKRLYRVTSEGRTGKQNPRTGELSLDWVTEDAALGMFSNWQKFSAWALDYKPEYLHGGYLIDRAGYKEFIRHIPEGVGFNSEAKVADDTF